MLSLVTLSATFPNVYGPAIFQQQQLQRQPQKEGKMYEITSPVDGCILALNITTSSGLCSSRARWPLVPNFCSRTTRSYTNHMLGTMDFTGSEHWAPVNFP